MTTYIVTVQENADGTIYIQFPDEMLRHLDWTEGSDLTWEFDQDDRLILRKKYDNDSRY